MGLPIRHESVDGSHAYVHLVKVAKVVPIVPHSNAGEERVFKLNRTRLKHDHVLTPMERKTRQ